MDTQRLPNESAKAYAAYVIYRELPVKNRSIDAAWREATKQQKSNKRATGCWVKWSSLYQWVVRAAERDKEQERIKDEVLKAEIEKIMSTGYAAVHKRVKHLDKLAKRQWKDMQKRELVWLPDVKQIGGGEFAERVDIIRYNAGLDEQFRKSLEDIAKETGGRVTKQEVSGPNGGPLPIQFLPEPAYEKSVDSITKKPKE